ncbi:MAG: 50S ribosomal protein L30 [candidate division Zixibacteria bacterium]|jgi:large subunit ribosomal protein L30|nr:50S ribosomal protein L30 [candidate division Zixibacteria bacterium]
MAGKLKVTQIKSLSGRKQQHIRTIEALGLKRIRHSVIHNDTPQIRGMIKVVDFMVEVEEV